MLRASTHSLLRVSVHIFLVRVPQDNLISSLCCIETLMCPVVWDTQLLRVLPYMLFCPVRIEIFFCPAGWENSFYMFSPKCYLVSFGGIHIFYMFFFPTLIVAVCTPQQTEPTNEPSTNQSYKHTSKCFHVPSHFCSACAYFIWFSVCTRIYAFCGHILSGA